MAELKSLGISDNQSGCAIGAKWIETRGKSVPARSPIDGRTLANVTWADSSDVNRAVDAEPVEQRQRRGSGSGGRHVRA